MSYEDKKVSNLLNRFKLLTADEKAEFLRGVEAMKRQQDEIKQKTGGKTKMSF